MRSTECRSSFFYRATLCVSAICEPPAGISPSRSCIVPERLNISPNLFLCLLPRHSVLFKPKRRYLISKEPP